MTTDLATVQQLHNPLELSERDREAAEAVASGLRDAKAANTRRPSGGGRGRQPGPRGFEPPRRGRVEWPGSPETAHKRAALDLAIIGVLADDGDGGHSARQGMTCPAFPEGTRLPALMPKPAAGHYLWTSPRRRRNRLGSQVLRDQRPGQHRCPFLEAVLAGIGAHALSL